MKGNKFTVVDKITNDAPYGYINYYTISFLTAEKVDKTKYLDIYGFKIHNGYNTFELSDEDANKIKMENNKHDVYIGEMGKLYAWDDVTKADSLQYDNNKLNDLEKTRRENVDKIKLMSETYKNNYTPTPNKNKNKQEQRRLRLQKRLYDKGYISKSEWEMLNEEPKSVGEIKEIETARKIMDKEMDDVMKTDYLDENPPIGLKFGCISVFMPNEIGGLQTMCFKVRGLFETPELALRRAQKIEKINPHDRIHLFEIGKWCGFSSKKDDDNEILLKRLNYAMKCYFDNLVIEEEKFVERQRELVSRNQKETAEQKAANMDPKFKTTKQKRKERKQKTMEQDGSLSPNRPETPSGNKEVDRGVKDVMNFLNDPELEEIMAKKVKKNTGALDDTMIIDI
jgi:hypothetical protein